MAIQGKTGACTPCPAGYAVATEGNSECDVCGPGTYQDQAGQSACTVRDFAQDRTIQRRVPACLDGEPVPVEGTAA